MKTTLQITAVNFFPLKKERSKTHNHKIKSTKSLILSTPNDSYLPIMNIETKKGRY